MQTPISYQSPEEIQEMLLAELENLFDKPYLIPVQSSPPSDVLKQGQIGQQPQQQTTSFKIAFEKDYTNTFLVTNPQAIFKVFAKDQFLQLPESTQCILLERLDDILLKCGHNALILTDHLVLNNQNVNRLNHKAIKALEIKQKQRTSEQIDTTENQRQTLKQNQQAISENDFLLLILQLSLKLANKNQLTTKKLIELVKKLTTGKRFFRCHVEYLYQYLKVSCDQLCHKGRASEALMKVDTVIKLLAGMFEQKYDIGPTNFFYFSGFLSGIQVNTKQLPNPEFVKISEYTLQDDKNLPVLFNCFFQGHGGFECYFNNKQLLYRILPKAYTPPTVESNGVLIGEFQPKKWYFLAIDHEKPFMTRPQLTAIINDKQVVNKPIDYPKIDKGAKISMIAICKNFVGQMSSFMLFQEQISNTKKLIQLYQGYEHGFHSQQQLSKISHDILDAKMLDKLYILYSPERSSNKVVYDTIDQRDGELMINSGVCNSGPKSKLFFTGGLNSLLPLLDLSQGITMYLEDNSFALDQTLNEYLKLIISVLSTKSFIPFESENSNFFTILFHLLTKLPQSSVNSQTISYLADIRFLIGDSKLQEQFFRGLMLSSDFWINTDKIDVINEYWLFVKAIYQQNPIQYNKIFSIQNLIDLMFKLSDIKDGHCCEYHRDTYLMFYQGIVQSSNNKERSLSLLSDSKKQIVQQNDKNAPSKNPFSGQQEGIATSRNYKIHHIDKFLAPIAGVLEGVLTCGGNEVLDQIQYIAKALSVKSQAACFHLQMLKLLKVLLLDSKEDRHCASPADFAAHFMKAQGLQILLYLCSYSSFDVKSMCVKLIDVLSSHTQLIKMAIDPDVITYLCNIILPRQMMDVASISHKNQLFNNLTSQQQNMIEGTAVIDEGYNLEEYQQPQQQYQIMEEEEHLEGQQDEILNESKDLEDHIEQLLMGSGNRQQVNYPAQRKFGTGLFIDDSQQQEQEEDAESEIISLPKNRKFGGQKRQSINAVLEEETQLEDPFTKQQNAEDEEDIVVMPGGRSLPPAPKNKSNPFKFDFGDDEDEDDSNQLQAPPPKSKSKSKQQFNQTQVKGFFGKQSKAAQIITEEVEEEDADDQKSEEKLEDIKQPQIGSRSQNDKQKFMQTQKLPQMKGSKGSFFSSNRPKGKGLELDLGRNEEDAVVSQRKQIGTRNTFTGGLQSKAIEFQEVNENVRMELEAEDEQDQFAGLLPKKKNKKEKESFANENVMSKSNLRQPKSFNFGFPDDGDDDEEEKVTVEEINEFQQNEDDEPQFKTEFFQNKRQKGEVDVTDSSSFVNQNQKSSLLISSNPPQTRGHGRNQSFNQPLTISEPSEDESKHLQGGTTGATSDHLYEKSLSRERDTQENLEEEKEIPNQQQQKSKRAVISYQQKAKLFTNSNNKLNIDTDAINELFNYGGEKGGIMRTEDEEQAAFEEEIEEMASMCLAAMNRKRPTDPIKYEAGKREKTTFESKYLANPANQSQACQFESQKQKNPRQQFMTPQSVRGIKRIEFSMSQEEKQAALEASSKDSAKLNNTLGSGGLSTTKNFGLKSATFSNNTIMEEMSAGTSKSSNSHQFELAMAKRDQRITSQDHDSIANQLPPQKKHAPHGHYISFTEVPSHMMTLQEPLSNQLGIKGLPNQENKVMNRKNSDDIIYQYSRQENQLDVKMEFTQSLGRELEGAKVNDEYTVELENLYTSCLEWIISRAPSSLYENIVIDECDKVGYQPAIQLLMTLVTYSNNIVRQRALTDLEMLAKWDSSNGIQIMMHPQFHNWLLELLMPYQDLTNKYSKLGGTSLAVYDIGCKLHTLLLKNACTSLEEEAYKKINFVARWPMIVQEQLKQGLKDRTEQDIQTAHKLSRVLLTQLMSGMKEEAIKQKPQLGKSVSPVWHNFVYTTYLLEEMVLASHQKEIYGDVNAESGRDYNLSLFKWVSRDYFLYYYGSNEKSLWADWEIIDSVFATMDSIYPEWTNQQLQTLGRGPLSIDESIFNLLEKCSADEFNAIVEVLLHDGSPYKNNPSGSSQQYQQIQKPSKAKGLLNNVLGGSSHYKIQQQQQQIDQQQQMLQQSKSENSFMKILLDLLCIALTQSDTKQLVQQWLDRFERFIKYIMIVSETWKSRMVSTIYNNYQRKFSEVITFAFSFLFHEIHATNRPQTTQTMSQSQQFNNTQQYSAASSSPKEQMFNKLYAQSLKNLMIYFINIIEYSKIKYTPAQLESHVTACRHIFNNVLIKNYSQGQENLINQKDISRFKQSDYDDFPECFYLDDWKFTFFYNETIRRIVKKHLSLELLQNLLSKRKDYACHYLDTHSSNEKTKEDILRRMQVDTMTMISQFSEDEFTRKNKVALLNDNFMREQGYSWRKSKKSLYGYRGVWHEQGNTYLIMNLYRTGEGIRCIMDERYTNGFSYIQANPELEKKIFETLENGQCDLLAEEKIKIAQSKQNILSERRKRMLPKDKDDEQIGKDSDEEDEDTLQEEEEDGDTPQYPMQEENKIIQFFSRSLNTREKIALKRQYIDHIKEYIFSQRPKIKEIKENLKCQILKPFNCRPGTITMTSHDLIFFDDLFTPSQQTSERDNIFFFKYQKRADELYYKIIPLQNLKELQKRRWLGRKTALEIFLMNGKTLMLNFLNSEDRDLIAKKIIRQRNQKCYNLKYFDSLEPKRILKKRELTEKWMQWKMSNFDYLMQINQLAGRSYNDLSQYPVFPWIITDFQSQTPPDLASNNPQQQILGPAPQGFRDLNKNMQLLGSAERQAEFKRKYDDFDSFQSMNEKFHCGSHYSNPGTVLHYMSRLSPYLDALVELHGKNLDTPDRGFHSIQDTLHSALTDSADVRELIPEFYSSPEMFLNLNKVKFGVKQDGVKVDNVRLPEWCQNDPYLFVIYLREAFESQYVSQNLNGWIDYIFGYKQKDQEAEKSLNTFSKLTYEDGIDIDSVTDQLLRQSYQEQIYHYGQTPSQLFQKAKHPQKLSKQQVLKFNTVVDAQAKIKVYKPVVQQNPVKGQQTTGPQQQVLLSQEAILKAKFVDDSTIVGLSKDGTVTYFFWLSKAHELNPNTPFTCCEDKKRKFDNKTKYSGIEAYDRSIKKFDFPLLILNTQRCILRGGFWGGKIAICPIEGISQDQPSSLIAHQSTVTAIVASSNEKTIISGSKNGDVIVWVYIAGGSTSVSHEANWQIRKHVCDHEQMVSMIHINEEMCMYITSSFDGTINLYNLWNDKFFRTFRHPKLAPIHSALLTQTPLAACCFYSREDHYWYSFSLNGHMLEKQREEASHIISPQILKDSHFMDKLVYGTEKGYLIFRQLPLLKQIKKQQVSTSYPVLSVIASPDRRFLLVGCGDGGLNVVTEPFQINQQVSSNQSSSIQTTQSSAIQGTQINTGIQSFISTSSSLVLNTGSSQQQQQPNPQVNRNQNPNAGVQQNQYRE